MTAKRNFATFAVTFTLACAALVAAPIASAVTSTVGTLYPAFYSADSTYCASVPNQPGTYSVMPRFEIDAASALPIYTTQTVYLRTSLYVWTSTGWAFVASNQWVHGLATHANSPTQWYLPSGAPFYGSPSFTVTTNGGPAHYYRIHYEYAWAAVSGAPSGYDMLWAPDWCPL